MKSKTYKKFLTALMAMALLVSTVMTLQSQNFVNGAAGQIKNAGTIRFVENTGEFQTAVATIGAGNAYDGEYLSGTSGTVEFAGTTNVFAGAAPLAQADASRINGWVHYSGAAGNQTVQTNTWYANLGTSGAAEKEFSGDTYVDHVYTAAPGAGARDYVSGSNVFHYDGVASENQFIWPESNTASGTNIYYRLYFMNAGVKTLQQGDVANAFNEVNIDGAANVTIFGSMEAVLTATVNTTAGGVLNVGGDDDGTGAEAAEDGFFITNDGIGTLAGNINIFADGTYLIDGTAPGTADQSFSGDVIIGSASGSFTQSNGSFTVQNNDALFLAGSSLTMFDDNVIAAEAPGHVVVYNAATLQFNGDADFVNQSTWIDGESDERANAEFGPTSTVEYLGSDDIVGTDQDNPYGHLVVNSATNVQIDAGTEAHVFGDFSLDQANLWADDDQDAADGSSEALVMINPTSAMNYTGVFEVVGGVERFTAGTSTTMTFNNTATLFGVAAVPASVSSVKLGIWPGDINTASDVNVNQDVDRRLLYTVVQSANDWAGYLRMGFLEAEAPAVTDEYYNSLRFREWTPIAGASDKVSTGQNPKRHAAGNVFDVGLPDPNGFGWVEIAGLLADPAADPDNPYDDITSGNELFLRGGPTWFITINNGRWSNPGTWDEGVQPGPNDLCLVRHTVWAGFVNNIDGYLVNEDVHLAANFATDESELASYIQIYNSNAGAGNYKGALLFGESVVGTDNAATHMVDPTWSLRENGTDYTMWSSTEDANIDQGDIFIVAKATADADAWVADADIVLGHMAATNSNLYNGGLFVFQGADGTDTTPTQLTIPTLLTNNYFVQNNGTIIFDQTP